MYRTNAVFPVNFDKILFDTEKIKPEIEENFIEGYIEKININNAVFSVIKPRVINSKYINQIVKFSKHDSLIKKFTHDFERFKDKYSFNRWYKKGKILYLLINHKTKLLGIIWFGKSSNNTVKEKLPFFTFAIRIYKPARGLGLSEKFFNITHNDLLSTLKLSKSKYNGLWLSTNCENLIAIHLYKKLGFKKFKKTNNELIMILEN